MKNQNVHYFQKQEILLKVSIQSKIEFNSMHKLAYFFSFLFLLMPKVYLLILIYTSTNIIITNNQKITIKICCIFDIIFLIIYSAIKIFKMEKTKYDGIMILFFKFYFPISANLFLF